MRIDAEADRAISGHYPDHDSLLKSTNLSLDGAGVLTNGLGLASMLGGGNATDLDIAAASQFVGSATLSAIASGMDKFADAPKIKAVIAGFGDAAGAAGAATLLAQLAQQLENTQGMSDQQINMLKAEIALQSVALGAEALSGGILALSAAFGAASSFSQLAGKFLPVLGAVTVIASALQPSTWAHFNAQQDYIDDLLGSPEHSAALLAELLGDQLQLDMWTHGVGTALDGITSLGAIFAGTIIGAPAGAVFGAIGLLGTGVLEIVKSGQAKKIAEEIAAQMRIAEDGTAQTIQDFFNISLQEQNDLLLAQYEESFDALMVQQELDAVFAFGSQVLTALDFELAAKSQTLDEVYSVSSNFFETYLGDGNWAADGLQTESVTYAPDKIYLTDLNGEKGYVKFTSPLLASGNERSEYLQKSTVNGEVHNEGNVIVVTDIDGWNIVDAGTNETTFDLSNTVVAFKHDGFDPYYKNPHEELRIRTHVEAGGGSDTLIASDGIVRFDGGEGRDVAIYSSIHNDFPDGATKLGITASTKTLNSGQQVVTVDKVIAKGTEYYVDHITSRTESFGSMNKNKREVSSRNVDIFTRAADTKLTDELISTEILVGTDFADMFFLQNSTEIDEIHGFGGNDYIASGRTTRIMTGGDGDDIFQINTRILVLSADYSAAGEGQLFDDRSAGQEYAVASAEAQAEESDFIYLDGGQGYDTVPLYKPVTNLLRDIYVDLKIEQSEANIMTSFLTGGRDDGSLAEYIAANGAVATSNPFNAVWQDNIEVVQIRLEFQDLYDGTTLRLQSAPDTPTMAYASATLQKNTTAQSFADVLATGVSNAEAEQVLYDGEWVGTLEANTMASFSGRVFLNAGERVFFRTDFDGEAAIFVDGALIYSDDRPGFSFAAFTARDAKFYDVSFFAHAISDQSDFHVTMRGEADLYARTIEPIQQMLEDSFFTTANLNQISYGDARDNAFHANDYNALIDEVMFAQKAGIETRETTVTHFAKLLDVYVTPAEGAVSPYSFIEYDWRQITSTASMTDTLKGRVGVGEELALIEGEIFLEAGKTYEFETLFGGNLVMKGLPQYDAALDKVVKTDELVINLLDLSDDRGEVTVRESGFYQYEFTALTTSDKTIDYYLKVKTDDNATFLEFDAKTNVDVMLNGAHLTEDIDLFGSDLSDIMVAGSGNDHLVGMFGNDTLTGSAGHDILTGAAGQDTFHFNFKQAGHDKIVEIFAEDWTLNTFHIDGDVSKLRFSEGYDNNLLITYEGITNSSITLIDFDDFHNEWRSDLADSGSLSPDDADHGLYVHQRFIGSDGFELILTEDMVSDEPVSHFLPGFGYYAAEAGETFLLGMEMSAKRNEYADGTATQDLIDEFAQFLVAQHDESLL